MLLGCEAPPQLAERFTFIEHLGSGASSEVYRARDRESGAIVAIKILRIADGRELDRLKRQFRTLSEVDHPNVVSVYELRSEPSAAWLSMEFIPGNDLRQLPRGPDALTKIAQQLGRGLRAVHDAKLVHGDLKPANIRYTDDGRVVICDPGCGATTPAYMSPRRALGAAPCAADDWYALAVILIELATGVLPLGPNKNVFSHGRGMVTEIASEILSAEGDIDPDDLLQRLGATKASGGSSQLRRRRVFAGRETELDALRAALGAAQAGSAQVVCVRGPAGIGKSSLLAQLPALARDALVLSGRSHCREGIPFKSLDGPIDELAAAILDASDSELSALAPAHSLALCSLFPALERAGLVRDSRSEPIDPVMRRTAAFSALREVLQHIAAERSVILVLDDAHYGDADSAALLTELARPPGPTGLLIVYAHRSGTTSPVCAALAKHCDLTLALGPLPERDVWSALRAHTVHAGASPSHQALVSIADHSGGHPLLLAQLLAFSEAVGHPVGPSSIELMIDAELRGLSPAQRSVVSALAVADGPLEPSLIANATGVHESLEQVASHLQSRRLIRLSSEGYDVYHGRVRDRARLLLDQASRAQLHGALAEALIARPVCDPERVARHLVAEGRIERALPYALDAAQRASHVLAFDRAAELYALAQRCGATDDAEVRVARGEALGAAGRSAEAAEEFLVAARLRPEQRQPYQLRAAELLLRSGHVDAGLSTISQVLAPIGLELALTPRRAMLSAISNRARLRLRWPRATPTTTQELPADPSPASTKLTMEADACWSIATGLAMVDATSSVAFHARHLRLALAQGDSLRIARGWALESSLLSTRPQTRTRARRLAARALRTARSTRDASTLGLAMGCAAMIAYQSGSFSAALLRADRALDILHRSRPSTGWERDSTNLIALWSLYYRGELAELRRRTHELSRAANARDDWFAETSLAVGLPAARYLAADAPELGALQSARVMKRWSSMSLHFQHYWAWHSSLQRALYRDDGRAALKLAEDTWPSLARARFLKIQSLRIESLDARARASLAAARTAAGEPQSRALLRSAAADARALAREGLPWSDALAALIRATSVGIGGASDDAIDAFQRAEDACQSAGLLLHAAAATRLRGKLLGGDRGARLVAETEAEIRRRGVAVPARYCEILIPIGAS